MTRMMLLVLLLAALFTGGIPIWDAVRCGDDPDACPTPRPTIDAGCEGDPFGSPCR